MIKPTELRIGNWVMLAGTYWQIGFAEEIDVHHFGPIPLTPEILEKAGFELIDEVYIVSSKGKKENHVSLLKINTGFACLSHQISYRINYVHQLQNLVYILTGTELEINLNP